MLDRILKRHPSFHFTQEIVDICSPLNLLNINYFAHINVDSAKQVSGLTSNPYFAEHYLQNHYYNADIHMAEKNLGSNIMWDFVNLGGKSKQMHQEAAQFGIQHTFTIIQKSNNGTDYYHFASKVPDISINQTYMSHLDLLKVFILHFREKVSQSKLLSAAYNLKVTSTENLSSYTTDKKIITPDVKSEFIKKLCWNKTDATNFFIFDLQLSQILTQREQECLYFYIHGKSPREIADVLFLSKRTIEQYMETIKIKLNVQNKSELIENVMQKLYIYSAD